jgi:hypothetical protein
MPFDPRAMPPFDPELTLEAVELGAIALTPFPDGSSG